jgi:hypothetical protein
VIALGVVLLLGGFIALRFAQRSASG